MNGLKIRLGYVAMTLNLEDSSPSGTVTYTALNRIDDEDIRMYRLRKVAKKNLHNTLRILKYNKALKISVYRLTSKLIPLATHPVMLNWNYIDDFSEELRQIGDFIKENDFRISAHPDHFTLINSPDSRILEDSLRDLDYHVKLYEAMGLDDYKYKLVMHVGGVYSNKNESVKRFCSNFANLPDRIRKRLIIENDDRSYNTYDVLKLCQYIKAPMVLDVHHHNCLCPGIGLEKTLHEIFDTWRGEAFPPKIHFSSPKNDKNFRNHADNIDCEAFAEFLNIAQRVVENLDVILEAKGKDNALLKLSEELAGMPRIQRISNSVFQICR